MGDNKFLDDLDGIVYYFYKDEKYIDLQTLMYIMDKDKTFTWRILNKENISYVDYQNRRIYRFDDIMASVELMELIDIDKLGI